MADLSGDSGSNVLEGGEAADRLYGGAGNDRLFGRGGADALYGGDGDDRLRGGGAADGLYGGGGIDTADYLDLASGVRIDLALGRASFPGRNWAAEALASIENAVGGDFDDTLIGSAGVNLLQGGGGDDLLDGGGGSDVLDGGDGFDRASYATATSAVRVDLVAQRVTFPGKTWAPETLVSIEGAVGGAFADTLIGDGRANRLEGGAGADSLLGGAGDDRLDGGLGRDALDGGAGTDTADYGAHTVGMTIDLAAGQALRAGSTAYTDKLTSIENAVGGSGNDSLVGSSGANVLDGGAGDDALYGGGGNDTFRLSPGGDVYDGGAGTDTLSFELEYEDLPEVTVTLESDENWYYYETVVGPADPTMVVDLAAGTISDAPGLPAAGADIAAIENVVTGAGNDVVYGSTAANFISVGSGANYVDGRGGDDVIHGSQIVYRDRPIEGTFFKDEREGSEFIFGGSGNDTIIGASSASGGAGADKLIAGMGGLNDMTGGAGADQFIFSDEQVTWEYRWYDWYECQRATIHDFNPVEGDKIVIELGEDVETPQFVGAVSDLDEGECGQMGGAFRLASIVIEEGYPFGDKEIYGVSIALPNFEGTLTASDVVFV